MTDGGLVSVANAVNLTTARFGHCSCTVGNYIYVIGGLAGTTYYKTIEAFSVNPVLGDLTSITAAIGNPELSAAKAYCVCRAVGNYIYVIGGYNGTAKNKVIEGFSVNLSTGALTALTGEPSIPVENISMYCCSVSNYLYVMGGRTTDEVDTITAFSVNLSTGALTNITSDIGNPVLNEERYAGGSFSVGTYIYAVAGQDASGTNISSIEGFQVNLSTGALTALTGETTLSGNISCMGSAIVSNFIYVLGGTTGSFTNAIEGFSVNLSTGALTALTGEPTLFANKRYVCGESIRDYMYCIGGNTTSTTATNVIECFKVSLPVGSGVSIGTSPMMIGV